MGLGIMLAGFSFGEILNSAAQADVFRYVLPFLLVFALIYGILSKTEVLGKNKGVMVIIALALGLLSLVGDYFPKFIQSMSPKLAIGISLLVAAIVLLQLFVNQSTAWLTNVLIGIGIASFIVIAYSSLTEYDFAWSNFWQNYGPAIVAAGVIIAIIWVAVKAPTGAGTPGHV